MEKDKNIKDTQIQNVFEQSHYFDFILKKAEKIVTALYLVTNLFPQNDPLKNSIRRRAICLLSDVNYIRQNFNSTNIRPTLNFNSSISNILSILCIAKNVGLISEMNHTILEKEIKNLAGIDINDSEKTIRSEAIFHDKFFETKYNNLITNQEINISHLNSKTEVANPGRFKKEMSYRNNNSAMSFRKEKILATDTNKNILKKIGQKVQETKNKRRASIKDLMRDNKFITIKDVMKLMKDCSEKTIQRELNSMVSENLIRREGTRRWSKYYQL